MYIYFLNIHIYIYYFVYACKELRLHVYLKLAD